ncbi:hypothetical protein [Priestia taiwanensis]|uniref:Uncharacterized protein n=1 Tax=Priestia taiwanensis TaxID=1347902 RepID=A0A917AVU9_9BACI|nr:hypothetical protein [Priestia taiwanensis]MBM7364530.1 hypothetical protein [Priestia taiwanensis]GGE80808.1 hypothetical protein GCM10007140_32890 [Priestia taiwanensis]
MKTYVKIFAGTSSLCMIFQFFFNIGEKSIVDVGIHAVMSGGLFGLFMTLFAIAMYKAMGKKPGEKIVASESITIELPYIEAFIQCLQSVQVIGKHEMLNSDEQQGIIEVKSANSMESFGEIITYTLQSIDEHRTHVILTSKPSWSKTIEDWGKNENNVRQIMKYIYLHKREKYSVS